MKIGTDISVLAEPGRSDATVLAEHLSLGDLAEPLGFDSLFGLEHHFTGYSMSPAPLQLLTYYAGRTSRITLGTCVIVRRGRIRSGWQNKSPIWIYFVVAVVYSDLAEGLHLLNMPGSVCPWRRLGHVLPNLLN